MSGSQLWRPISGMSSDVSYVASGSELGPILTVSTGMTRPRKRTRASGHYFRTRVHVSLKSETPSSPPKISNCWLAKS